MATPGGEAEVHPETYLRQLISRGVRRDPRQSDGKGSEVIHTPDEVVNSLRGPELDWWPEELRSLWKPKPNSQSTIDVIQGTALHPNIMDLPTIIRKHNSSRGAEIPSLPISTQRTHRTELQHCTVFQFVPQKEPYALRSASLYGVHGLSDDSKLTSNQDVEDTSDVNANGPKSDALSTESHQEGEEESFRLRPYNCSLEAWMRFDKGILESEIAVGFVIFQLFTALGFAHSRKTTHGSLSPEAINLSNLLYLKLSGFTLGNRDVKAQVRRQEESKSKLKSSPEVEFKNPKNLKETPVYRWVNGEITNLEYLLELNRLAGRNRMSGGCYHPILPWVSDLSVPATTTSQTDEFEGTTNVHHGIERNKRANSNHWRDLTKSKFRLKKGDMQLDMTYENASSSAPGHHVTEALSDVTYFVYKARRTRLQILQKVVRQNFQPNEYPASMHQMYNWTPDECIPEFYLDTSVTKSKHKKLGLDDLKVPDFCSSPANFIRYHRSLLESEYVSEKLHHWIDLTFGFKLSGDEAIKARNVVLKPRRHYWLPFSQGGRPSGYVQLFSQPHPKRFAISNAVKRTFPGNRDQKLTSESSGNKDSKDLQQMKHSPPISEFQNLMSFARSFSDLFACYSVPSGTGIPRGSGNIPSCQENMEIQSQELLRQDWCGVACLISDLFACSKERIASKQYRLSESQDNMGAKLFSYPLINSVIVNEAQKIGLVSFASSRLQHLQPRWRSICVALLRLAEGGVLRNQNQTQNPSHSGESGEMMPSFRTRKSSEVEFKRNNERGEVKFQPRHEYTPSSRVFYSKRHSFLFQGPYEEDSIGEKLNHLAREDPHKLLESIANSEIFPNWKEYSRIHNLITTIELHREEVLAYSESRCRIMDTIFQSLTANPIGNVPESEKFIGLLAPYVLQMMFESSKNVSKGRPPESKVHLDLLESEIMQKLEETVAKLLNLIIFSLSPCVIESKILPFMRYVIKDAAQTIQTYYKNIREHFTGAKGNGRYGKQPKLPCAGKWRVVHRLLSINLCRAFFQTLPSSFLADTYLPLLIETVTLIQPHPANMRHEAIPLNFERIGTTLARRAHTTLAHIAASSYSSLQHNQLVCGYILEPLMSKISDPWSSDPSYGIAKVCCSLDEQTLKLFILPQMWGLYLEGGTTCSLFSEHEAETRKRQHNRGTSPFWGDTSTAFPAQNNHSSLEKGGENSPSSNLSSPGLSSGQAQSQTSPMNSTQDKSASIGTNKASIQVVSPLAARSVFQRPGLRHDPNSSLSTNDRKRGSDASSSFGALSAELMNKYPFLNCRKTDWIPSTTDDRPARRKLAGSLRLFIHFAQRKLLPLYTCGGLLFGPLAIHRLLPKLSAESASSPDMENSGMLGPLESVRVGIFGTLLQRSDLLLLSLILSGIVNVSYTYICGDAAERTKEQHKQGANPSTEQEGLLASKHVKKPSKPKGILAALARNKLVQSLNFAKHISNISGRTNRSVEDTTGKTTGDIRADINIRVTGKREVELHVLGAISEFLQFLLWKANDLNAQIKSDEQSTDYEKKLSVQHVGLLVHMAYTPMLRMFGKTTLQKRIARCNDIEACIKDHCPRGGLPGYIPEVLQDSLAAAFLDWLGAPQYKGIKQKSEWMGNGSSASTEHPEGGTVELCEDEDVDVNATDTRGPSRTSKTVGNAEHSDTEEVDLPERKASKGKSLSIFATTSAEESAIPHSESAEVRGEDHIHEESKWPEQTNPASNEDAKKEDRVSVDSLSLHNAKQSLSSRMSLRQPSLDVSKSSIPAKAVEDADQQLTIGGQGRPQYKPGKRPGNAEMDSKNSGLSTTPSVQTPTQQTSQTRQDSSNWCISLESFIERDRKGSKKWKGGAQNIIKGRNWTLRAEIGATRSLSPGNASAISHIRTHAFHKVILASISSTSKRQQSQLQLWGLHSPTRNVYCNLVHNGHQGQITGCSMLSNRFEGLVASSDTHSVHIWDLTCSSSLAGGKYADRSQTWRQEGNAEKSLKSPRRGSLVQQHEKWRNMRFNESFDFYTHPGELGLSDVEYEPPPPTASGSCVTRYEPQTPEAGITSFRVCPEYSSLLIGVKSSQKAAGRTAIESFDLRTNQCSLEWVLEPLSSTNGTATASGNNFVTAIETGESGSHLILAGTNTGHIIMLDDRVGKCMQNVRAHSASVSGIVAAGKRILTTGSDKTLNVWNTTSPSMLDCLHKYTNLPGAPTLPSLFQDMVICTVGNKLALGSLRNPQEKMHFSVFRNITSRSPLKSAISTFLPLPTFSECTESSFGNEGGCGLFVIGTEDGKLCFGR